MNRKTEKQLQAIWREFHNGQDFSSWTLVDLGLLPRHWYVDDPDEEEIQQAARFNAEIEQGECFAHFLQLHYSTDPFTG